MKILIYTFFNIIFINIKTGIAQTNGECHFPRLTPRHALNIQKLMGKWYLQDFAVSDRGFDTISPQFRCNELEYVPDQDFEVTGKFTSFESNINTTNGRLERFTVPIQIPKRTSPHSSMWNAKTITGDTKMLVLNVDRDHSAWYILYSCSIFPNEGKNYRWETVGIWSRKPLLDFNTRQILKDFLIGLGFPIQSHKTHSQKDCI